MAAFDGGSVTSDAGSLLLKCTDEAIRLFDRLAAFFLDRRIKPLMEHTTRTLVGNGCSDWALGYEEPWGKRSRFAVDPRDT